MEIVRDDAGDAFRVVYTVRFADVVYVLHAFQKKSTHGRETPKRHIEKIHARLKTAQQDYLARRNSGA